MPNRKVGGAGKRPTTLEPVEAYEYQRLDGSVAWWKVRYLVRDRDSGELLGKTFRPWWQPPGQKALVSGDPPFIDRYPYELPRLFEAVSEGYPLLLVEGEKDCHTVMDAWGHAATTHPSGVAGGREKAGFSRAQLEWVARADRQRLREIPRSRILIVADRDPTGAWLAYKAWKGLIAVGWPAQGISLALPAAEGEHVDVSDHIEQGWSEGSLIPVRIEALRRLADVADGAVRKLGNFKVAFGSGGAGVTPEWLEQRRKARGDGN